jgi:glycosyltransferase involved in cell wall biosynthesis
MDILFVGPLSGYTSYPVVCKGILRTIIESGIRPIVADVSWDGSQNHTDSFFDTLDESKVVFLQQNDMSMLVHQGIPPADYDCNICVALNPSETLVGVRRSGVKVFGLFVGDVDVVPESWQHVLDQCDVVMTPSAWCRDVIAASGVKTPLMVLNHGIASIFSPISSAERHCGNPNGVFVFLHMCSAVFCPERKGTPQFFKAIGHLVDDGCDISARVVFGMQTRIVKQMLKELPDRVKAHTQIHFLSGARPQDEIIKTYNGAHAVVFPSRAEGFGCIPLEVRACGIPVVQTLCTGHRDHLEPGENPEHWGVVPVTHGPLTTAWANYGRAPSVESANVANAMKQCIGQYDQLRSAAMDRAEAVRMRWSWSETTKPLIELIKNGTL